MKPVDDVPTSSAAIFSMSGKTPTTVPDDLKPLPPQPKAKAAPSRTPSMYDKLRVPQSVLDDVAKDIAADHPGSKWFLYEDPAHLGLALFVEVKDLLTKEIVGQARGTVSLLPLLRGESIGDQITAEAERMINSIPSPL